MTDFFDDLERELRRAHRRDTERSVLSRVFVRWRLSGLRVAGLRPVVALAVVVALVAVVLAIARESDVEPPPAAPAKKVVTTDLDAGIRWRLDGRVLTVQLLPGHSKILGRVSGARISATCGANGASPPSDSGATTPQLWPAGEMSMSYLFRRDVSKWCRLEDPVGRSVAFVVFPGAGALEEVNLVAGAWRHLHRAQELLNCGFEPGREGRIKSQAFCERKFPDATVQEIAIKGDRATVTYSHGQTIELHRDANGAWVVSKGSPQPVLPSP
jgi:hypothetical protein